MSKCKCKRLLYEYGHKYCGFRLALIPQTSHSVLSTSYKVMLQGLWRGKVASEMEEKWTNITTFEFSETQPNPTSKEEALAFAKGICAVLPIGGIDIVEIIKQ